MNLKLFKGRFSFQKRFICVIVWQNTFCFGCKKMKVTWHSRLNTLSMKWSNSLPGKPRSTSLKNGIEVVNWRNGIEMLNKQNCCKRKIKFIIYRLLSSCTMLAIIQTVTRMGITRSLGLN